MMIEVVKARKAFKNEVVLNGLDMNVHNNSIYGLLGPSGCGKTVLLSCILGKRFLDSGKISIGISDRRDVGYMPQEIALFLEFTVREIFMFYGRLFGLSISLIKDRTEDLTQILHLPPWKYQIGSLSGGEQRRVSFAVSLLHDPKLLILDEPTVGLDAVLSHNIWMYLRQLSANGKTIVITTHYVEEARQAHSIGLMRGGILLYEGTPETVMTNNNCLSIEEAFLHLSKKQEESQSTNIQEEPVVQEAIVTELKNGSLFDWNRFTAQLLKNIVWMKRNTVIMFFLLLLPAMQSFFYCISFGQNPTNLSIILVSDELNSFQNDCSGISNLNCSYSTPFTCQYINELKKDMNIEIETNIDLARQNVIRNKAWGFIYIRVNFSKAIMTRINGKSTNSDESESNESEEEYQDLDELLTQSTVLVTMDMSTNLLTKKISESFSTFLKKLLASCGLFSELAESPVKFMEPIYGNMNPVFAHSGLPGFFCSFCFYFTMIFTSGAIMMEKLVGLLDRSMAAGMTYMEIIGAHLAVQFILMTAQKSVMLMVFYYIYDNPMLGSINLIIILLFLIESVGISYGFLLTEIFASDRLVSYAGIGATLAVFSLGGIIWPMEGAHPIIRSCVWLFPVAPAVESYKAISSKGYDLTNKVVYQGFLSCFLWTILLVGITFVVAKAKRPKSS